MFKKSIFIKLIIILSCINLEAQTQTWQWAKNTVGADYQTYPGIIKGNDDGTSYVSGVFRNAPLNVAGITIANQGTSMFVAKLGTTGNAAFAKSAFYISGAGFITLNDMAIDKNKNIYLCGTYNGIGIATVTTYPSTFINGVYKDDYFVMKLNASGNLVWFKHGGPLAKAYSVAVDSSNNVYVTGAGEITSVIFGTTFTYASMWHAKLNSAGNLTWLKRVYNNGAVAISKKVVSTTTGITYVTGYFVGPIYFGTTINDPLLTGTGSFLAKYNSSGICTYAKKITYNTQGSVDDLNLDQNNNPIVYGSFDNQFTCDGGATVFATGNRDIFLAKYSSAGTFQWAQHAGYANSYENSYAMATDNKGNSYVTGDFNGALTFGTKTINAKGSNNDCFIGACNSAGVWQWALAAGGNQYENARSIACDSASNLYSLGYYDSDTCTFGNINIYNTPNNIYGELFFAKLQTIQSTNTTVINKATVVGAPACSRDDISVSFTKTGIFNANNVYSAQLSNAAGSFATPTVIGSITGANANPIPCTLPTSLLAGTGYKIRVVGTNPVKTGIASNAFTINACAVPNPSALASSTSASITWADATCAVKYQIRYRVNGTANYTTIDVNANNNLKNILNLVSATTYQYSMRSMCESTPDVYSAYSATKTFTTTTPRLFGDNYSSAENNFVVSPNPSKGDVNIEFAKPVSINSIEIYNTVGKMVKHVEASKTKLQTWQQINVGNLPSGIYLLIVNSDSKIYRTTLVVE
nr:T9SS type A sorting domain-containing protein [Bacteroidota bacterium]